MSKESGLSFRSLEPSYKYTLDELKTLILSLQSDMKSLISKTEDLDQELRTDIRPVVNAWLEASAGSSTTRSDILSQSFLPPSPESDKRVSPASQTSSSCSRCRKLMPSPEITKKRLAKHLAKVNSDSLDGCIMHIV